MSSGSILTHGLVFPKGTLKLTLSRLNSSLPPYFSQSKRLPPAVIGVVSHWHHCPPAHPSKKPGSHFSLFLLQFPYGLNHPNIFWVCSLFSNLGPIFSFVPFHDTNFLEPSSLGPSDTFHTAFNINFRKLKSDPIISYIKWPMISLSFQIKIQAL